MGFEPVDFNGKRYAEIIWADTEVDKTVFFSGPESSMQFGILSHSAGFTETPHCHHTALREIRDLQQMFVVQRGVVAVLLYDDNGRLFKEIILRKGDSILLIHGVHSIRVIEDMKCISVKQGPFLGADKDKINVEVI